MTGPRAVAQEFFDLFAAGKIAESRDLFDPTCITVTPGGALDVDQHEGMGHAFRGAFPDARMDVEHAVESGDVVMVLGRFRGTHSGEFVTPDGTIPASGNDLNLRFMEYFRVIDGKITEHQSVFDQMELLGQMNALPG
jgi:predicted ester cyclase